MSCSQLHKEKAPVRCRGEILNACVDRATLVAAPYQLLVWYGEP